MKSMFRTVLAALLAMCALGEVASASASAVLPECDGLGWRARGEGR